MMLSFANTDFETVARNSLAPVRQRKSLRFMKWSIVMLQCVLSGSFRKLVEWVFSSNSSSL